MFTQAFSTEVFRLQNNVLLLALMQHKKKPQLAGALIFLQPPCIPAGGDQLDKVEICTDECSSGARVNADYLGDQRKRTSQRIRRGASYVVGPYVRVATVGPYN